MRDTPPKSLSSSSFPLLFLSLRSSVASAALAGRHGERSAPAACSTSSGRGEGGPEDMSPFGGDAGGGSGGAASAVGPTATGPDPSEILGTKPLEQMTPREVMRLLPTEDQDHVMRIAKQGRMFGFFSAAAAGTWVYKALRRRGSPLPIVGGALIGLTLGYPLGITLTMAFHGRFLRKISQDLMETQRRARERAERAGSPAPEYYSTFPAAPPGGEQQSGRHWGDGAATETAGQQGWADSTELLDDTRAADAAVAAQREQQGGALTAAGGGKVSRIDGTGKGDEILKV